MLHTQVGSTLCMSHGDQSFIFYLKSSYISYLTRSASFEYLCYGSTDFYKYKISFSAGTVFIRHTILTHKDGRCQILTYKDGLRAEKENQAKDKNFQGIRTDVSNNYHQFIEFLICKYFGNYQ